MVAPVSLASSMPLRALLLLRPAMTYSFNARPMNDVAMLQLDNSSGSGSSGSSSSRSSSFSFDGGSSFRLSESTHGDLQYLDLDVQSLARGDANVTFEELRYVSCLKEAHTLQRQGLNYEDVHSDAVTARLVQSISEKFKEDLDEASRALRRGRTLKKASGKYFLLEMKDKQDDHGCDHIGGTFRKIHGGTELSGDIEVIQNGCQVLLRTPTAEYPGFIDGQQVVAPTIHAVASVINGTRDLSWGSGAYWVRKALANLTDAMKPLLSEDDCTIVEGDFLEENAQEQEEPASVFQDGCAVRIEMRGIVHMGVIDEDKVKLLTSETPWGISDDGDVLNVNGTNWIRKPKVIDREEAKPHCHSVKGSYKVSGGDHTDNNVSIFQHGCDVRIETNGQEFAGRVNGSKVSVDSFETDANITDHGNLEWGQGISWLLEQEQSTLDCADFPSVSLTKHEVRYATCPPGRYLSIQSAEDHEDRARRLRKALCRSKAAGKATAHSHSMNSFAERGYMTFESGLWPKDDNCSSDGKATWSLGSMHKELKRGHTLLNPDAATSDSSHEFLPKKLVNTDARLELRRVPKAASGTLSRYIDCEVDGDWRHAPTSGEQERNLSVVTSVRDPVSRFISAANDVLERLVNRNCMHTYCSKEQHFHSHDAEDAAKATSWLAHVNPKHKFDPNELHRLLQAMVRDTGCNLRYYGSSAFISQATMMSQNSGAAADISLVIKVEEMDKGIEELARLAHGPEAEPDALCDVLPRNVAACSTKGGPSAATPSKPEIEAALLANKDLLRELCLIYAQDFICFDYELPSACANFF